jgi:hypothetical protein
MKEQVRKEATICQIKRTSIRDFSTYLVITGYKSIMKRTTKFQKKRKYKNLERVITY